ncbi:hypothetical protein TrST_g3317 [Triparma strigata]|uniref:Uncharacterized protein n=1 Tax=Triparma strigata TaxID=1606541 RepID=A0A9W7AKY7_9STRA|nr:hypothetical protein TrST_g3317 [Triparma strigata]
MLFVPGTSQDSNPNKTYQKRRPPKPPSPVKHYFEGDGGVVALQLGPDPPLPPDPDPDSDPDPNDSTSTSSSPSVLVRVRLTRTAGFLNERKIGYKRYTALESTRQAPPEKNLNDLPIPLVKHHFLPGLNKKRRNTSNSKAVYWGGKLLTLWEGGLPYKLDPLSLGTAGKSQLGAVLKATDSFGGSSRYDSTSDTQIFYSQTQSPSKSTLTVYAFDRSFKLTNGNPTIFGNSGFGGGCTVYELPGFTMVNDIGVTSNYYISTSPKLKIDGLKYNLFKDPGSSIEGVEGGGEIFLMGKKSKDTVIVKVPNDDLGDLGNFWIVNSYESDDSTIVIDGVRSLKNGDTVTKVGNVSKKILHRYKIKNGKVVSSDPLLPNTNTCCSFATVNEKFSGVQHTKIFCNVGEVGQGIGVVDVASRTIEEWYPDADEFCGEPTFVPKKVPPTSDSDDTETHGYLITISRGQTESTLLVFDADDVRRGPISAVPLGVNLPHGLRGCWTDDTWREEEIRRTAKLNDKLESKGQMFNEVKSDFSGLGLRLDDFDEYGF